MITNADFYNKLFSDNDEYSVYSLLGKHTEYNYKEQKYITSDTMYDLIYDKKDVIKYADLSENGQEEDLYVSVNSIFSKRSKRNKNNLRSLNAFVLDYDYYKNSKYEDLSANEMYHNHIKETLLFEPTFVVDSGRGLYVIYTFKQANAKSMTAFYEKIWSALIKQQQEYDFMVDSLVADSTQVIRLIGSYNSKSKTKVSVIEYQNTNYVLNDFSSVLAYSREEYEKKKEIDDLFYDEIRKNYSKRIKNNKTNNSKKRRYKSRIRRSQLLLNDFKILAKMERSDNHTRRRTMLYQLNYQLRFEGFSEQYALNVIQSLNNKFDVPLSESEIKGHCIAQKIFENQWSKTKIMEELSINTLRFDEQNKLKYLVNNDVKNEINKRNQRIENRDITGNLKSDKSKIERQNAVFVMHFLDGKRQKEIAEELNISKSTVSKDVKYIKENRHLFRTPYEPIAEHMEENINEECTADTNEIKVDINDTSPPPNI